MTLISSLIKRFRSHEYRHAYVESLLYSYIATQIKVLREQRGLRQSELAELAGMHQSQISKLENVNNSAWKINTLQKIARAFDLRLVVRLESFGSALPEIEQFGRASLTRPSFDEDPVFRGVGPTAAGGPVSPKGRQIQTDPLPDVSVG